MSEPVDVDYEKFINDKRLTNEFDVDFDDKALGHGGFGVVIKAKNKIDDKLYAIKMVAVREYTKTDEEVLRKDREECSIQEDFNLKIKELKIWAKLADLDPHCVQYRSAWLEKDEESRNNFLVTFANSLADETERNIFGNLYQSIDFAVLHIQMDLCEMSLKDGMHHIQQYFNVKTNKSMPLLAYYMSSQILIEVLEAINYLHRSNPVIIHRDIKPANFLIKIIKNGRSIKLSDFGLAALHEYESQYHTKNLGTEKYMAPEVRNSKKYTEKADIYSLGVLMGGLFHVDINAPSNIADTIPQYNGIIELIAAALRGQSRSRPECSQMLDLSNNWAVNMNPIIKGNIEVLLYNSVGDDQNNSLKFIKRFLEMKLISCS